MIFNGSCAFVHNVKSFQKSNKYIKPCGNPFHQEFSTFGAIPEELYRKGPSRSILLGNLERALKDHQVDMAWESYKDFKRLYGFPDQLYVSNLITELSYSSDSKSLRRASDLVLSISKEKSVLLRHEAMVKLSLSLARAQIPVPTASVVRLMLEKRSLPPLDVLQMVFLHLVKTQIGTYLASNILEEIGYCFQKLNMHKSAQTELTKPDATIFNIVLDACVRFGSSLKAQQIIELMPQLGVIGDAHTVVIIARQYYDSLLSLHFKFNDIGEGFCYKADSKRELVFLKNGKFVLSNKGLAKLIIGYKRHGRIDELSKLLISIHNMLNSPENSSPCSDVIDACISLGWLETAHDILEDLELEKYCVRKGSYTSLLTAYYNKKMFREADALVRQSRRVSLSINLSDETTLSSDISDSEDKPVLDLEKLNLTCKSDLGDSIVQNMREEDKTVSFMVHEYNSSIYFFTTAKMIGDAIQAYRKMQKMKIQPNVSTFSHLIIGHSSLGMYREITVLWGDIKRSMKNQNTIYNRDLYELLLLNFIRGGYFERVMEVTGFMMENNIFLDKWSYKIEFLKFHRDLYRSLTALDAKDETQSRRIEHVQAFRKLTHPISSLAHDQSGLWERRPMIFTGVPLLLIGLCSMSWRSLGLIQCFNPQGVWCEISHSILHVSVVSEPSILGLAALTIAMADGTRSMEMCRELDGYKEQMEKSIADLKDMIAVVANSVQNNQGGTSGAANIGDDMAEEPGGEHVPVRRQNQWFQNYQAPTRFSQIEFPKFRGEDLRGWIYRCEQFFEVDDTPPDAKVKIAAVHLEGKALQWHQIFMKNRLTREVPQWGEYVRALNDRFGTLLYENPMSELVNLKETRSIQDYLDRFDELMNCVDLSEPYAISCFLRGLKSEVAIHVRMFKPRSLQDAISLAKLQEHANSPSHKKLSLPTLTRFSPLPSKSSHPQQPSRFNNSPFSPSPQPHTPTTNRPPSQPFKPSLSPVIPSRRLSPQELDDKRARGLCFWCDEKFSPGHQCSRRKQLYIMEVTEDEGKEDELEPSEELAGENKEENSEQEGDHTSSYHVSMNAMTGNHDFRTMRVTGTCKVTLGDINWNLKELKMVFYMGGQKVFLRGKQPPTVETVSNKKMRKHLHNPAQVAMMQVGVFATAQEEESSCLQIEEYENTTTGWLNDEKLQGIIHKLIDDPDSKPKYEWKEGLLTRKGRLAQRNNRAITQVLVKWFNAHEEDSTWENLHELRLRFPAFNP
ncbi:hypothetical protein BUALT_Bualt03G0205200 [Buddleja alternifolia]|uniref:Pentatricopeptide repeat-containing protein n=1 Tax=Buddleja alternifolia TaxID=168488 RepID=A0AAV6Y1Z3_9LAMI|nr:hypothetical protein BUALT_Bualt03G0205200 [Buddleja alternifolia]